MTDPNLFWTIFSAVLAAIILGGTFFWGLIAYSRHEKAGTAGQRGSHLPLIAILMPLLFGLMGVLVAFDRTAWLDTVLQ